MLLLQVTKKLAEQLNIKTSKDQVVDNDLLYSWHAHLFLYKRRKYALVMNNKSRYNFILGSLVKKDFMKFDELVKSRIRENLLADGFDSHVVDKYIEQCDSVNYAPTSMRNIISQINDTILITKHMWEADEIQSPDLDKTNRGNNKVPFLQLPESHSLDAMKNAMKNVED